MAEQVNFGRPDVLDRVMLHRAIALAPKTVLDVGGAWPPCSVDFWLRLIRRRYLLDSKSADAEV